MGLANGSRSARFAHSGSNGSATGDRNTRRSGMPGNSCLCRSIVLGSTRGHGGRIWREENTTAAMGDERETTASLFRTWGIVVVGVGARPRVRQHVKVFACACGWVGARWHRRCLWCRKDGTVKLLVRVSGVEITRR